MRTRVNVQRFGYVNVDTGMARGLLPALVFRDGVEVSEVIEVNDLEGWLVRWKAREVSPGVWECELKPGSVDELATERWHGRIRYMPNTQSQRPARTLRLKLTPEQQREQDYIERFFAAAKPAA